MIRGSSAAKCALPFLSMVSVLALMPPVAAVEGTVSLAADNLSLSELARELTRQTGTPHRASGKDAERQKIVIFCRDQPAAGVRKAVSDLLGWSWSESQGDGGKSFVLVRGLNLRRREAALRARFTEQYEDFIRELSGRAAEEGNPAAGDSLSPLLVDPTSKALLGGLSGLSRQQLQGMSTGRALSGSPAGLPHAVRQLAAGVLAAENRGRSTPSVIRGTDIVRLEVARDATGRPESVQLAVYRGGRLQLQFNAGHVAQAQAVGRKLGAPPLQDRSELLLRDRRLTAPLAQLPPLEWPKAPAPMPTQIGWQARDLSRRTPLPLIADCYPEMEATTLPFNQVTRPYPAPALNGITLLRALERLADEMEYDWNLHGDWIALRYRNWYWEPLRGARSASTSTPVR